MEKCQVHACGCVPNLPQTELYIWLNDCDSELGETCIEHGISMSRL